MTDHDENPYAPPVPVSDPFEAPRADAFNLPHRGGAVLGLGIAGLALLSLCGIGFFLGLPAWIMGARDLRKMQAGQMDPGGHGMTRAGKICGSITTILSLIAILIYLAAMLVGYSEGGSDYSSH